MKPLSGHKTVLHRPVDIVTRSCAVPGGKKVSDVRDVEESPYGPDGCGSVVVYGRISGHRDGIAGE